MKRYNPPGIKNLHVFGAIGVAILCGSVFYNLSRAATTTIALEAEAGTKAAPAQSVPDNTASAGLAVKFTTAGGGYPNATNTGPVAAGYTKLSAHAGGLNITSSGTYSGYNVSGTLTISASNVIFQGCDIHGATDGNLVTITGSNVQILDCAIHGDGPTTAAAPQNSWVQILGSGITIKRTNFYNSSGDGIRRDGSNFDIEDSYIHDWVPNPTNDPHIDGITEGSDGPVDGVTIRHNTVLMWSNIGLTNVISLAGGPGNTLTNVLVDNNVLAGGGYIFHGGGDTVYSNMTFSNNKISTQFTPSGGNYGVMRNAPIWGTKNTSWTNNTWYDGPNIGKIITAP